MRTVRLPDGVYMCWCGLLHHYPDDADRCAHKPVPIVPGLYEDRGHQQFRGGTPGTVYAPGKRRARRRALATLVLIAATLVGLFALMTAADPGTGGPRSTPTTYGHPSGGVR